MEQNWENSLLGQTQCRLQMLQVSSDAPMATWVHYHQPSGLCLVDGRVGVMAPRPSPWDSCLCSLWVDRTCVKVMLDLRHWHLTAAICLMREIMRQAITQWNHGQTVYLPMGALMSKNRWKDELIHSPVSMVLPIVACFSDIPLHGWKLPTGNVRSMCGDNEHRELT